MQATLTARSSPRLKPSKWPRQDNLGGTDQHGPGSHTLNPHIHADAVTAGRVPRRTKKVDYVPTGKVKWYDKEKGFGFLAGEDGQEVFLPRPWACACWTRRRPSPRQSGPVPGTLPRLCRTSSACWTTSPEPCPRAST